jgi:WD40-like Beta Propeller Repeat
VKRNSDGWDKGRVVVETIGTHSRKTLIEGGADGRYLPTGHLVYALSGVLLAVPFDIDRLEVLGGAMPVIEGIQRAGIAADGTGIAQFSYSATGMLAYLPGKPQVTEGNIGLALFDRKGAVEPLRVPSGAYLSPRVSRDGKFLAIDTDDGIDSIIWIYDLLGSTAMRRLTFGGRNRAPVWSPDGQWIAFQSDREGDVAIFRQRADGSGAAERLTKPEAGATHTPDSWSPDGASLLFTVQNGQQFTLWTMFTSDRRVARFGDVRSAEHLDAAFSPDGRWVAYPNEGCRQFAWVVDVPAAVPERGSEVSRSAGRRSPVLDAENRRIDSEFWTEHKFCDRGENDSASGIRSPHEFLAGGTGGTGHRSQSACGRRHAGRRACHWHHGRWGIRRHRRGADSRSDQLVR